MLDPDPLRVRECHVVIRSILLLPPQLHNDNEGERDPLMPYEVHFSASTDAIIDVWIAQRILHVAF